MKLQSYKITYKTKENEIKIVNAIGTTQKAMKQKFSIFHKDYELIKIEKN